MVARPVCPVGVPARLFNSNVTCTGESDGFTRATPVCIEPICPALMLPTDSTNKRNALVEGDAGTPASGTVMPSRRYEKIRTPDGVLVPFPGITRTQPVCNVEGVLAARSTLELRGAMV